MKCSLSLVLTVCFAAQAFTQERLTVPVSAAVKGESTRVQGELELTFDGDALAVAYWIDQEDQRWTAEAKQGPTRTGWRAFRGSTRRVVTSGLTGGLSGSQAEHVGPLHLSLVFDDARGQVRGFAYTTPGRMYPPTIVHSFRGLLPIRVKDRWIGRTATTPRAPGWIDPFTGGTPDDYSEEGLPLPAPRTKVLGPVTVLVPGMFNLEPTREFVLALAKHSHTVVIAFANPHPASTNTLRAVTELDGEPLPPELEGRILVHGSPERLIHSYLQGSDRLLQVLEDMRRSPLISQDPFEAEVSVVGHCQGALAALLTRRRLRDAGLQNAIGLVIGLAPPSAGLSQSESKLLQWTADRIAPLAPGLPGALRALHPQAVESRLGTEVLDVVLSGYSDSTPDGDGLVTLSSASSRVTRFEAVKDTSHAGIFHDPRIVRLVIPVVREELARQVAAGDD